MVPTGPYFAIKGIDEAQRTALSTRSRQIAEYMAECGLLEADGGAAREMAALNTRQAKSEPSLPELLDRFETMATELGITPEAVLNMRQLAVLAEEPFAIDHAEVLEELLASQSCATEQEALAAICQRAMGSWNAAEHKRRHENKTQNFHGACDRELLSWRCLVKWGKTGK